MGTEKRKILIVEDDMIISMVLERMVLKLDFAVAGKVTMGKEAIESFHQTDPDLILMDIQLDDDVDGITAMEEIRTNSDVPVIYITGNSDQYNMSRARKTDFVDYLIKPIQMDDLKSSIKKAFQKEPSQ